MKKLPITLAVAAFALFAAQPGHAFDLVPGIGLGGAKKGGIKIRGNVDQSAAVDSVSNSAISGGQALVGVASIREGDVQVNGNVDQSAALSNANNIAQGRGSVACLDVATIGDLQPCDGYD